MQKTPETGDMDAVSQGWPRFIQDQLDGHEKTEIINPKIIGTNVF